jgi:hypothetical protein
MGNVDKQGAVTSGAVAGPTCSGPAHLVSQGGKFAIPPIVEPIYWGTGVANDTQQNMNNFMLTLTSGPGAESPWLKVLMTEYGVGMQPIVGATITPHFSTGATITRSQVEAELNWQLDNHKLPDGSNGNSYLFMLHFPPAITPQLNGLNACTPGSNGKWWCAYHNTLASRHAGTRLTYGVIPDHNTNCSMRTCAAAGLTSYDAMTVAETHEIAEALTDPDVSTGFVVRSSNDTGCMGAEIGDVCGTQSVQITNAGHTAWVQRVWSNKSNACVVSPGALADMDGDLRSDLTLTGGASWSTMPIAFSDGTGTYHGTNGGVTSGSDTNFATYATQSGATPVAGDFDGDGLSDIALTGGSSNGGPWGTIPIAFSNGASGTYHGTNNGVTSGQDTSFTTYATQSGAKPVAGDFDGDGLADIALTGGSSNGSPWRTIPVAFSNGSAGTFRGTNKGITSGPAFPTFATQTGAKAVSGDFNCDGLADIALVGGISPNGLPWTSIPVAYSNGDGSFWVSNSGIIVGDTRFTTEWAIAPGVSAVSGDFDGDCRADIALTGGSGWGSMPIAHSNGDGTFSVTNAGETGGSDTGFALYATQTGARPAAGDFNGDGYSDLALLGGVGWGSMPIAFSNGFDGTFNGQNSGETSGDTGFPGFATASGAKPVTP